LRLEARNSRLFVGGVGNFRQFAFGGVFQFGADHIGGETGAEQAAVERGNFALIERAAKAGELSLQARAHGGGFVGFGEGRSESSVDVLIGHATRAQLARDAEAALLAKLRALAGEFGGVASVVEVILLAEAG